MNNNNGGKKKPGVTDKQLLVVLATVCVISILISYVTRNYTSPLDKVNEYVFIPIQHGINEIGTGVVNKKVKTKNIKKLQAENEELKKKIDSLENENSYLQQSKVEYDRLKKLYKIDTQLKDYHKIAANVVSKGSSNWFSEFVINKGSKQGIKKDMNVISDAGLVGIVTDVGDNYSRVMSIISDSSNVKGMTLSTSAQCFVAGDLRLMNEGYIHILQVQDPDDKIQVGDKIITSNISTKYLPGILIGYVRSIESEPNQILKSGYLSPATDFSALNEVLVITDLKETWDSEDKK